MNFKALATLTGALTVGTVIGVTMAPDQLVEAFVPAATTQLPHWKFSATITLMHLKLKTSVRWVKSVSQWAFSIKSILSLQSSLSLLRFLNCYSFVTNPSKGFTKRSKQSTISTYQTNHFKTMNFKALALSALVATTAIVGGAAAKADFYSTYEFGNSTYTYGSNGSSFNTTDFGNSTYYNGTDRNGNSYSGSCTSVGNSTFCF